MEKQEGLRVIIVAPDRIITSSLQAFLSTIPAVRNVGVCLDRLPLLEEVIKNPPDLLIVDVDAVNANEQKNSSMQELVKALRTLKSAAQVIFLVNNLEQKRCLRNLGGDQYLLKGLLEEPLLRTCIQVNQKSIALV